MPIRERDYMRRDEAPTERLPAVGGRGRPRLSRLRLGLWVAVTLGLIVSTGATEMVVTVILTVLVVTGLLLGFGLLVARWLFPNA